MSFKNFNGIVRKIGRKAVLPDRQIKAALEKVFERESLDVCVDFGAGTLFWSEWLQKKCAKTWAVDIIFDTNKTVNGVKCTNDLNNVENLETDSAGGMFFMSDVLHHLNKEYEDELLSHITQEPYAFKYIVIKDINCHKRFGNMMNRLHDKIINGETIRDIDPDKLLLFLKGKGYECEFYNMRKLWYPHFLIVAKNV